MNTHTYFIVYKMQERERWSLTLKIFKTPGYGSIWVLQYFHTDKLWLSYLISFGLQNWSSRCCKLIFVFLVLQNNSIHTKYSSTAFPLV